MDFDDCPCSGKSLARMLQPAVMAVLAWEPLHGYRLLQRLEEMVMFRDHPPDATGLYRLLKWMEDDGSVIAKWDLPSGGPAKRLYELTPRGRLCLQRWVETLEHYQAAIGEMLGVVRESSRTS